MRGSIKYHTYSLIYLLLLNFLIFSCIQQNKKKPSKKSITSSISNKKDNSNSPAQAARVKEESPAQLAPNDQYYIKELEDVLKKRAGVHFVKESLEQETKLTLKFSGKDLESLVNARFLLMKYIKNLKAIGPKTLNQSQIKSDQIIDQKIILAEKLLEKVNLEFQIIYQ